MSITSIKQIPGRFKDALGDTQVQGHMTTGRRLFLVRFACVWTRCPVAKCPHLCTSDARRGMAAIFVRARALPVKRCKPFTKGMESVCETEILACYIQ